MLGISYPTARHRLIVRVAQESRSNEARTRSLPIGKALSSQVNYSVYRNSCPACWSVHVRMHTDSSRMAYDSTTKLLRRPLLPRTAQSVWVNSGHATYLLLAGNSSSLKTHQILASEFRPCKNQVNEIRPFWIQSSEIRPQSESTT